MRTCLVQMAPRIGDIEGNLDRHLEFLERARREKAGLVVFPELSLTGYNLKDLVPDVAMDPVQSPVFRKILDAGRGMSVVFGFVEESEAERGLFYNSAAFCSDGRLLHVHRKVFLPTAGMFEEGKFFAQGRNFRSFRAPFGRSGLMICRDFLQTGASYLLFADGAEVIIVISAAPGRGISEPDGFETGRMWELMGESTAYFATAFVLYCNRVGIEDGMTFAGGSFIFNPRGEMLARAAELDEEFLVCEMDLSLIRQARKSWTFKRDDRPEMMLHALERIVRGHED